MATVFLKIYDFFVRRKFLLFAILFVLVAIFYTLAIRIKFNEDITDFLPKTKGVENITDVFKLVSSNNKLIVIISEDENKKASPDELIACADKLSQEVKNKLMPDMVKDMTYRISEDQMTGTYDVLWNNLPYFLDATDYDNIATMMDSTKIDSILQKDYKLLVSPAGIFMRKFIVRDPLGLSRFALQKMSLSGIGNSYEMYKGFIFSKDKKHLLMFLSAANPTSESYKNTQFITKLDDIIQDYNDKAGNAAIKIQYYGAVAAAVGNAGQLRIDFYITMGIALLVLLIFFAVFFKNKGTFFVLMTPVLFGGLFSFGVIYLIHPHISLIAIGAGSIILGIAINYSVHFYAHYRHVKNLRVVIKDLALPLTLGSTTTIGAFLGLMLVKSDVLRDFGLFSALCLVGSVLFTLVFFPFFIKTKHKIAEPIHKDNIIDKISAYKFDRNPYILGGIVVLTVFFFIMARKVSFEDDMNKLGYTSTKLKQAEQTLSNISDSSLRQIYVVSKGKTLNESLKNNEIINRKISQLQAKNMINQVAGVSSVLLSDSMQRIKAQQWENFWNPHRIADLKRWLLASGKKLKFRDDAFLGFLGRIEHKPEKINATDFDYLKQQLAGQFINQDADNNFVVTVLKINPQKRDAVVKALPEDQNTVIVETHNLLSHFIDVINNDFNTILLISSLLVFFFLLFSYGRIELAIITFIPMFISWIWILGIMSLLDIKFNIFSIIISTFIFGLGDDFSIFIMDGMLQEYKRRGVKLLDSYKTAVFLSAFTTLIGVGVLIFAQHPALKSIALLTIIGMFSVVFLSYTIPPALFRLLVYKKDAFRKFPLTAYDFLYAVTCYTYFLTGCFITALLGLSIYKILPVGRKNRRWLYHITLMIVCRSTMYLMYFTRKKIINLGKDTFKKPAVIIANHQSLIDIPLFLMFSPKVIMITNDKFYYSKFIGIIVKLGGFMPASAGFDFIGDKLATAVAEGYSIMVFPEGTRNNDGRLHRFHKGAFYLAEKMKLDILPLVSHGTGDYITKGELMGKKSLITVKFLDRIRHDDAAWGEDYSARAKNIQALMRNEYELLLNEHYRKPKQFRDIVIRNFVYKGPIVEWYTRIKLRLERNYQVYDELIPRKAKITDIGCGYGYLSLILGMVSSDRHIHGVDYDEEKIEIAEHCMSKPRNVYFSHGDITECELEPCDVFILSDVLHYFSDEKQLRVIEKCIHNLNPGGRILIRDGNSDLHDKHKLTRFTEFFSTNIGFNKTDDMQLHFLSATRLQAIVNSFDMKMSIINKGVMTSNMLFLIEK